jgi:hypothetical protein
LGELAVDGQVGVRHGADKTERIEVGFEISPAAVCVEHALTLSIRCVQYCGRGSGNSFGSIGHMSVTRIMDEVRVAADSAKENV